jgi:hypothetical protein
MKKQGEGTREQGVEDLIPLLRGAIAPVRHEADLERDLWPIMRARLSRESDGAMQIKAVPWFDWALAGGVAVCAVAFPAAIPVLLYYL